MPKSKRNKQVELSKTKKRGLEWKKNLFQEIRNCVDSYSNVFVFSVSDMRNSKMKNVRDQWKHSRFFIGKNKIMAMALGRFVEEEYKPNLHKIGKQIKGQRGLLFSNKSTEEVLSWFRSYTEGDFARSGNTATENVNLVAGPLAQFVHSLEPYLRQLGLPTSLVKGVVHLVKDHEVCKEGDTLSPETAKILKLLGYEMAEFHITINCVWSQDGSFLQLTDDVTDTKENLKKKKKKKRSNSFKVEEVSNPPDTEEMEIEDEVDDDHPNLSEDEVDDDHPNLSNIEDEVDDPSNLSKIKDKADDDDDDDSPKLSEVEKETSYSIPNVAAEEDESNTSPVKVFSNSSYASTPKEKSNDLEKNGEVIEENSVSIFQKEENPEVVKEIPKNAKKQKVEKPSNNVHEDDEESNDTGRSRSRKRKGNANKAVIKNVSLCKTPDANTSQDSPVFRELRNRSVKVSRKRNKK